MFMVRKQVSLKYFILYTTKLLRQVLGGRTTGAKKPPQKIFHDFFPKPLDTNSRFCFNDDINRWPKPARQVYADSGSPLPANRWDRWLRHTKPAYSLPCGALRPCE
jgi:hypothetical protein